MQIDAKEIEFINTKVDAEYPATINIKAERTRIENQNLKQMKFMLIHKVSTLQIVQ